MKRNSVFSVLIILLLLNMGCNNKENIGSENKPEMKNIQNLEPKTEQKEVKVISNSEGDGIPAFIKEIKADGTMIEVFNKEILAGDKMIKNLYEEYSKSKDDKLLKGRTPIDIFLINLIAMSKSDLETICYLTNLEGGELPSLEEFLEEVKNDESTRENTIKLYEKLMKETKNIYEVIKDENTTMIYITLQTEDENEPLLYRFEKTENGIWKFGWLASQ